MKTDIPTALADDEIARYAYHLWEAEGRLQGRDVEYWLQAKAHLTARLNHDAGLLKKAAPSKASRREIQVAPPAAKDVKPLKQRRAGGRESPRAYA